MVDYIIGTAYLAQVFSDGGHTAINYPAILALLTPGTAVNNELNRQMDSENFRDQQAVIYVMNSLTSGQRASTMSEFRSVVYGTETI
jgi:hypothetical protein